MISLEWTKHLKTEKQQEEFRQLLLSSRQVLGRLYDLLEEKEESLTKEEISPENYDAGYPFRQAHQNGRRHELTKLIKLLEFTQGRP